MKNKWITYLIIIIIVITLGANQYVRIKYDISMAKYMTYAKDFTQKEKQILDQYPKLIYGGNINEPPLGLYSEENGQYLGLVVDHISALSIELEKDIISRPMIWHDALEALKKGETNLCDMIPSPERAEYYEFTDPIYALTGVVVVKKEDQEKIKGSVWEDITIAVAQSDYILDHVKGRVSPENIVYTNDIAEGINLLEKGTVNAVAGDEPVLRYYLNELQYRENYEISPHILYKSNSTLAIPKMQKELVPILNKAIFHLKKNGTLPKINSKWLASSRQDSYQNTQDLQLTLLIVGMASFVLLYTAYMWNRSLANRVSEKTKELAQTKDELELTFNTIKNYIFMLDHEGKITNINHEYARLASKNPEDLIGENYRNLPLIKEFEAEYGAVISKILDENLQNQNILFKEAFELKTGGEIYRVRLYPLEYNDHKTTKIAIMIENITGAKEQEAKLTQENKMSAVGQLAAGIAHELRNPLGVIRNSTFLLNESWDDSELRDMSLHSINDAIKRSSDIIDDLLNFSRKNSSIVEKIKLKDHVDQVYSFYKPNLSEKNIQFLNEIDPDIEVLIDQTALRHILLNLIQNAIDAIDHTGVIRIYAELEAHHILLHIEDDGSGIDDKEIEKIFDPFFTTKEIGKGTGLGLYIVYTEIEKLKGEISVKSKNGKTTFSLKLPIQEMEKNNELQTETTPRR